MEDLRPQILEMVRAKGPILPLTISSELKKDSIFVGAYLSDLLSMKQVYVSTAKIGGSALYYTKGQESKLEMLYKYLELKEKEAFDLLKRNKVMKDKGTDPAIRVAFRNLKDFAKPIEVRTQEGPELFWKWYLTTDDEVVELLDLKPKEEKIPEKIELKIEKQETLSVKQEKPKAARQKSLPKSEFFDRVSNYLQRNNIKVIETIENKRGNEVNMVVSVPSSLGELGYFLVAKPKQTINDADLSLAHQKGHTRKLPVLFLSTGDLTNKANSYLEKNMKGYLNFKKM